MAEEFCEVARGIIAIGNMLLVAQGPGEGFCHLPGGHCERGEEPADCLVRELREELGREVSALQKVTSFDNVYDRGATTVHERNHLFAVKLYPALVEQPPRSAEEHLRLRWVALQDLDQLPLLPPAARDWVHTYAGA